MGEDIKDKLIPPLNAIREGKQNGANSTTNGNQYHWHTMKHHGHKNDVL